MELIYIHKKTCNTVSFLQKYFIHTNFPPLFHTCKSLHTDKSGEAELWNLKLKELINKYIFKSKKYLRPEYKNQKFLNKGG